MECILIIFSEIYEFDIIEILSCYFSLRVYGLVSLTDSILIIGGRCDNGEETVSSSTIAKYTLTTTVEEWSKVGNLQKPRDYHRAMINGNRIYVVGGNGNL